MQKKLEQLHLDNFFGLGTKTCRIGSLLVTCRPAEPRFCFGTLLCPLEASVFIKKLKQHGIEGGCEFFPKGNDVSFAEIPNEVALLIIMLTLER